MRISQAKISLILGRVEIGTVLPRKWKTKGLLEVVLVAKAQTRFLRTCLCLKVSAAYPGGF